MFDRRTSFSIGERRRQGRARRLSKPRSISLSSALNLSLPPRSISLSSVLNLSPAALNLSLLCAQSLSPLRSISLLCDYERSAGERDSARLEAILEMFRERKSKDTEISLERRATTSGKGAQALQEGKDSPRGESFPHRRASPRGKDSPRGEGLSKRGKTPRGEGLSERGSLSERGRTPVFFFRRKTP
jgi:hypothetical protein